MFWYTGVRVPQYSFEDVHGLVHIHWWEQVENSAEVLTQFNSIMYMNIPEKTLIQS